jgi:hypothetical protein
MRPISGLHIHRQTLVREFSRRSAPYLSHYRLEGWKVSYAHAMT